MYQTISPSANHRWQHIPLFSPSLLRSALIKTLFATISSHNLWLVNVVNQLIERMNVACLPHLNQKKLITKLLITKNYFPHCVREIRSMQTINPTHTYSHNTPLKSLRSNQPWQSPSVVYKSPVRKIDRIVGLLGQNQRIEAIWLTQSEIINAQRIRVLLKYCSCNVYVHSEYKAKKNEEKNTRTTVGNRERCSE